VDWEFIHVNTRHKIRKRVVGFVLYFTFEFTAFMVIYLISSLVAKEEDKAHED
jgi:hypothetical protein